MARLTGKHIRIKADGTTVGYNTGWTLDDDISTTSHYGTGFARPAIDVGYVRKSGSFTCEADPSDALQESLKEGAIVDSLEMYLDNSTFLTAGNVMITQSISASRGGKIVRTFSWVEVESIAGGGQFQLNGGPFSSLPDPLVLYGGKDRYGMQLNRQIYGPFENFSLLWADISSTALLELKLRIDGTNGARVAMTLAVTSPTVWSAYYGCIHLQGFRWEGTRATDVTAEVSQASTSAI